MKIQIQGIERLNKKLSKIAQPKNMVAPMTKACLAVETDAKINCPVDDGQLRQSITHEVLDEGKTGVIGTNVEYAPYVHQGTGIYAVNGDGRKDRWSYKDAKGQWHSTIGQHPQPFLEQALDANAENILTIFKNQLEKEMSD